MRIPKCKMQEGIDLCKKNISEFLEDARLLVEAGRLQHALVSVEFAKEEFGKIVMLREASVRDKSDFVTVGRGTFKSHKGKNKKAWTILDPSFRIVFSGDFSEEDFEEEDFVVDTTISHYTRLQCAFVAFDESSNEWHIGRDIDKDLLVDLIEHIQQKLSEV